MTKSILTNPDQEDAFFINRIKIDVAKKYNVCQSKIDVFWSDIELEYVLFIEGLFAGYYDLEE